MIIYPAIDIKDGQCVRLQKGDMQSAVIYGEPCEMAKRWQAAGAKYLHIVDLDAAFAGEFSNFDAVEKIIKEVSIPVQLGGGIRTMQDIDIRLKELKIARVIIGTAAYENPELVAEAHAKYPGRIAAGIDAKEGRVALKGWAEEKNVSPVALALQMKEIGIRTVIYTDITKDGMLAGPNIPMTREMIQKTGMDVIASGGIGSVADIAAVRGTGAAGVIVGKALYTGNVELKEALQFEGL
jgi:phosphoribosylformimino-5-aminoimidazole carboxamide ribotide isomerase